MSVRLGQATATLPAAQARDGEAEEARRDGDSQPHVFDATEAEMHEDGHQVGIILADNQERVPCCPSARSSAPFCPDCPKTTPVGSESSTVGK